MLVHCAWHPGQVVQSDTEAACRRGRTLTTKFEYYGCAPALSTIHSPVLSTRFARTLRRISSTFPSRTMDMSRGIHSATACARPRRE